MCLHAKKNSLALGVGGKGQGGGLPPEGEMGDASFTKTPVKGKLSQGVIIGKKLIQGIPQAGEARVQYSELIKQSQAEATEALSRQAIPVEYRHLVQNYFESIRPRADDDGK